MAAKKQQTHAKRAREFAVKERRERKQAKKAEAAAQRAAGDKWPGENGGVSHADELAETTAVPRARAQGIEFRHSDSGYALIDAERKPVHGRRDMTLDEIESWLEAT